LANIQFPPHKEQLVTIMKNKRCLIYQETTTAIPVSIIKAFIHSVGEAESSLNNNNNNNNKLQLGCHSVAVVILHVYKIRSWLLINLRREGYMRSM